MQKAFWFYESKGFYIFINRKPPISFFQSKHKWRFYIHQKRRDNRRCENGSRHLDNQ